MTWNGERCEARNDQGQQCVLQPGHAEPHSAVGASAPPPPPPPPPFAPPPPPPPSGAPVVAADDAIEQPERPAAEQVPEVESAFVVDAPSIVHYDGDRLQLHVSTVPEAKLAIKELRLLKKDLASQRKALTMQKAEENARWRERQAGRFPGYRSRGIVGSFVQSKRRAEKMGHADTVNKIAEAQGDVDRRVRMVDSAIAQLEAYILKDGQSE